VRAVPLLCEFYSGICLTTEEKARKNLTQGKKNLSQVKKNLSHSAVHILPKTPTHYKALTNKHITKPTHTHTHTTKQYKTTTVQINTDWMLMDKGCENGKMKKCAEERTILTGSILNGPLGKLAWGGLIRWRWIWWLWSWLALLAFKNMFMSMYDYPDWGFSVLFPQL
jgi:hypothetical protein